MADGLRLLGLSSFVLLLGVQPSEGQVFFSPDSVTATNSDLPGGGPEHLIDRSGIDAAEVTLANLATTTHSDGVLGDGWRGNTAAFPITLTFDFVRPQSIDFVALWQSFSAREGTGSFQLRFWSGTGGSGLPIGAGVAGILDDGTGSGISLMGKVFAVGARRNVRSITMEITSVALEVNPHVHLGEVMVASSSDPAGSMNSYEAIPAPAGISWEDARDAAVARGGYLAALTTEAENTLVWHLIKDRPELWFVDGVNNTHGPWIGGFQEEGSSEPGGGWQWVSGEGEFEFTRWSAGEPNNWGNAEHRLSFFGNGPNNRAETWNDLPASPWNAVRGFVVEYGGGSGRFGNGNVYEAVPAPGGISWEDARDAAAARGGHLATVTSIDENEFVWSLIRDRPELWYVDSVNNTIGPWIGGFQLDGAPEPGGGWHWVNGEGGFDYSNWAAGEPNDFDNAEHRLCYFGIGPDNRASTWNDLSPAPWGDVLGFVVEYEFAPTFVSPVAVSAGGGYDTPSLENMINGSGLTAFNETGTHTSIESDEWRGGGETGTVRFDLGSPRAINGLYLWNQEIADGAVSAFSLELLSESLDSLRTTSTFSARVGTPAEATPVQLFSFETTNAVRYVDMRIEGLHASTSGATVIAEAGFSSVVSVFDQIRITSVSFDRESGLVSLTWEPFLYAAIIEHSSDLIDWEVAAPGVFGTSWSGSLPGTPTKAFLRVRW